ncbi:hypothetical protein F383_25230 [Gossypium arboreum]|uniref:Uncharacterized protein n=1 Tax=Gossypium arboreum TaxID=29729 RepID=A0A0B0MRF1_GOSAR|nr:hypothetical protein F383_25230 [Gossypium arboreum]
MYRDSSFFFSVLLVSHNVLAHMMNMILILCKAMDDGQYSF